MLVATGGEQMTVGAERDGSDSLIMPFQSIVVGRPGCVPEPHGAVAAGGGEVVLVSDPDGAEGPPSIGRPIASKT